MTHPPKLLVASLLTGLICWSGCSSVSKFNPNHTRQIPSMDARPELPKIELPSLTGEKKIRYGKPVAMAVIWKDTVYSTVQAGATRGFGGRFYFYDAKGNPVRVDGDLHVYGFDDSGEEFDRARPDRKLTYRREEFQGHFSETDLGPSYSVWVPWDKVGGYRKTISLLPVFKPAEGEICQGGLDLVVLPGLPTAEDQEAQRLEEMADEIRRGIYPQNGTVSQQFKTIPTHGGEMNFSAQHALAKNMGPGESQQSVQRVSHESIQRPTEQFRTTTISVPRDMASRLASMPPQQSSQFATNHTAVTNAAAGSAPANRQQSSSHGNLPANLNPYHLQQVQDKLTTLPGNEGQYQALMQQKGANQRPSYPQNFGQNLVGQPPAQPGQANQGSAAGTDLRARLDQKYNTDSSQVFGVPGSFNY